MLMKLFRGNNVCTLARRSMSWFSSGHHDGHGHGDIDYSVNLDKHATWIKYRSDAKLIALDGVIDTHYEMAERQSSDPFPHIKDAPFFSFNRWYFTDPWYHDDDHQPYNSNGDRGYINGDDPLETRYLYVSQSFIILTLSSLIILSIAATEDPGYYESSLYKEKITRDYVYQELTKKNTLLKELRSREKQLINSKQAEA